MTEFAEIIIMNYNIIISPDAEKDTKEAYTFYENKQPGLGERFLDELALFYKKLREHPMYYSFVSDDKAIRSLSLKIFPYQIIYEVAANELYVFAIHHFRQNPDQFIKRL